MPDTLILMVLALVVFGPRRLPKIGRQIGKLMYEFRKASNDFKFQMEEELRKPKNPTGGRKRKRSASARWPLLLRRRRLEAEHNDSRRACAAAPNRSFTDHARP